MVLFTAHGIVYIVYWIIIGRYSEVIKLSSIFRVVITDNDVIYTHLYYVSWPKHLRYQKKKNYTNVYASTIVAINTRQY